MWHEETLHIPLLASMSVSPLISSAVLLSLTTIAVLFKINRPEITIVDEIIKVITVLLNVKRLIVLRALTESLYLFM